MIKFCLHAALQPLSAFNEIIFPFVWAHCILLNLNHSTSANYLLRMYSFCCFWMFVYLRCLFITLKKKNKLKWNRIEFYITIPNAIFVWKYLPSNANGILDFPGIWACGPSKFEPITNKRIIPLNKYEYCISYFSLARIKTKFNEVHVTMQILKWFCFFFSRLANNIRMDKIKLLLLVFVAVKIFWKKFNFKQNSWNDTKSFWFLLSPLTPLAVCEYYYLNDLQNACIRHNWKCIVFNFQFTIWILWILVLSDDDVFSFCAIQRQFVYIGLFD